MVRSHRVEKVEGDMGDPHENRDKKGEKKGKGNYGDILRSKLHRISNGITEK